MGGGTRSAELTLPGFTHLVWLRRRASVAHPMDDGRAATLYRSLARTGKGLGRDAGAWTRMLPPSSTTPAHRPRGTW